MSLRIWQGALFGVTASLGVVASRWLTAEPFLPILIPIDVGVFALVMACLASIPQPRVGGRVLRSAHRGRLLLATIFVYSALLVRLLVADDRLVWDFAALAIALPIAIASISLVRTRREGLGAPRSATVGAVLMLAVFAFVRSPASAERLGIRFPERGSTGKSAVILIVLDTVARNHLALYGYPKATMPRLDQWAQDALVVDDCESASSWTLPSHASLFTGLPPRSHGAHGFRNAAKFLNAYPLAPERVTLAERARAEGIATGAIVANHVYVTPQMGLDQGFDTFWCPTPEPGFEFQPSEWVANRLFGQVVERARWPYYRARHITDRAIEWLTAAGERSLFLFVNYMDAHEPHPPAGEPDDGSARFAYDANSVLAGRALAPDLQHQLVEAYDHELTRLDRELARLLDFVAQSPLAGRTTIFVTSDHGQYFGEHQLVRHSRDLHESVIAVPLIVRGPGVDPGRSQVPVDSSSVHDAVIAALGLGGPGESVQTVLARRREPRVSEWYAAENGHDLDARFAGRFDRDVRVLREGDHKLFVESTGEVRLFDLAQDPGELDDIAGKQPGLTARLRGLLELWLKRNRPAAPAR